jgi:uncharacterized repeat protein (TIGR03847 family)
MPRRVFSFDPPDRFVCGAVGQPGQRIFFLQASKGGQVVSVALEKAQVAVLAERLALLLLALRDRGVELPDEAQALIRPEVRPLAEPVVEEFRVGTLTLTWDADDERVVIEAREMTADDLSPDADDEEEPGLAGLLHDEPGGEDGDGPDLVRVHLEPVEARAFVAGAVAVVEAGRPPCPICGAPLDPTGHFCPRRNGYTH